MKRSRADTALDPSGVGGGDGPVHLDHAAGEPVMVGIVAHHHRLVDYCVQCGEKVGSGAIASLPKEATPFPHASVRLKAQ